MCNISVFNNSVNGAGVYNKRHSRSRVPWLGRAGLRGLVESGKNIVEAQQEQQNRTGTEPMQQVANNILHRMERTKGVLNKMQNY